ncbi:hypothetical protein U3A58_06270 [Algoriphagus sp. C2-6-M1]|uniref:hypothetical protein n=1 Tax=Algoriphagus persicinus TaxID=3108754 RepID=UPI002B3DB1E0|nr:hypothetical protein [Algoriphagus sp. C2-6-M1]MEB2779989.1 hypothetical protein [Algoriphagus sp. C2-6-M1]
MKYFAFILITIFFFACQSENKTEEINPIYYVQVYNKQDSKIERILGKEFGELQEINSEFVFDDSSAYVFAWEFTEVIRESFKDEPEFLPQINGFKLYNSEMTEITKSVTFEGIKNYPNQLN